MNNNALIFGSGAINQNIIFKSKPQKVFLVRGPFTKKVLEYNQIECPKTVKDSCLMILNIS